MNRVSLLIVLIMPLPAVAIPLFDSSESEGWHWYNELQLTEDETESEPVILNQHALSPLQRMELLQKQTKEALSTAIMEPTVEHFARFKRLQDFWTTQASQFSMVAQQTMLIYPELDYNLKHSHYNGTARLQQAADLKQQAEGIREIARRYGVFMFYRGNEAVDAQLVGVVKEFTLAHAISLIPISVDGKVSDLLPQTRLDHGQAARLGVSYFPALILVDPKASDVRPLAYGFISQDDLAKRFLYVATDFKPNF